MARTIGIDLGTTGSRVAVVDGSRPAVIANAEGERTTPSCVAFAPDGQVLVGTAAARRSTTDPQNAFSSVMRRMAEPAADGRLAPEALVAYILGKLKADAEAALGEAVDAPVITVPAHFGHNQRLATKEAARIAGLEVRRLLNEPTAAAVAYAMEHSGDRRVLVVSLGGGATDASAIEIQDGDVHVLATAGGALGGDDFDRAVVAWLVAHVAREHGVDVAGDPVALRRLSEAAEMARVELSSIEAAQIAVPYLTPDTQLDVQLTRARLEELTAPLLDRVAQAVGAVLAAAGSDLDELVLVGGMSRMPAVREKVRSLTGLVPHGGVDSDEAAALGAAVVAAVLTQTGAGPLVFDVLSAPLVVATPDGARATVVERNTVIPTRRFVDLAADGTVELLQAGASLGRFEVRGGLRFDVDSNGIVALTSG
jgi:molecular chaperone DnaK